MFVYSSYHLNISFPSSGSHFNKLEQVLETPTNGFVQEPIWWAPVLFYSQNYAARALPILFNTPKRSLLKSSYPKKYLPNFCTQKNPSIIPITWNPEYHPLGVTTTVHVTPITVCPHQTHILLLGTKVLLQSLKSSIHWLFFTFIYSDSDWRKQKSKKSWTWRPVKCKKCTI